MSDQPHNPNHPANPERSAQPKVGTSLPPASSAGAHDPVQNVAPAPTGPNAPTVPALSLPEPAARNGLPVFVPSERVRWLGKAVPGEGVSFAAPGDEGIVVAVKGERVQVRLDRTARIQECDRSALMPLPADRFSRVIADVLAESAARYGGQGRRIEEFIEEVRQTALACERMATTPQISAEDVQLTMTPAPAGYYTVSVPVCASHKTQLHPDRRVDMQIRRRTRMRSAQVVLGTSESARRTKATTLDAHQLRSAAALLDEFSPELSNNDRLMQLQRVQAPENLRIVLTESGEAGISLAECGQGETVMTAATLRALARLLDKD